MNHTSSSFFKTGRHFSGNSQMQVGELTCKLNMPAALQSAFRNGEEIAQHLPPYNERAAFLVDRYPKAPASWMRSSAETASYMVPVLAEHGLWLDFNGNRNHKHEVAILISIQGVNALTGQKSDCLRLEQYRNCCPVHGSEFSEDRLCKECGFMWPPQNYIATTAAPNGLLWLDGFLAADGVTRQWVFTEKELRGVAKAILGEERVHAIGVAFFLSKEPKPVQVVEVDAERLGGGGESVACMMSTVSSASSMSTLSSLSCSLDSGDGDMSINSLSIDSLSIEEIDDVSLDESHEASDSGEVTASEHRQAFAEMVTPKKRYEIAAGAKIDQPIHLDPKEPSYWREEPAGIIVINYTDEETMFEVLQGGVDEAAGSFLTAVDVPVGH